MAYSSGGLIEAWDYNLLTWGGNTTGTYTSTPSNFAYVWGVGTGAFGYGQDATTFPVVAAGGTVTATQWSTFVQRLNLALAHQSGTGAQLASGSNIGITAGATIQYLANVSAAVSTVNTNAALSSASGTTITGTVFSPVITAAAAVAYGPAYAITRTVTFSSGDAARYFFNAGGYLNFVITSVTNNDATTRSGDAVTLLGTNLGGYGAFRNTTGGGRTGSGGTLNTNATTIAYRTLTTAQQTLVDVTSTTASYTTDNANLRVQTNAINSSGHGDFGSVITFVVGLSSPAHSAFNGTLNVTINHRIDIVPPETTYLGNSWGSITIA